MALLSRQFALHTSAYTFLPLSHTAGPAWMVDELFASQKIATRTSNLLVRCDLARVDEFLEGILAGWCRRPADVLMAMHGVNPCQRFVLTLDIGFAAAGTHL